jgi:hypothetical protein
VVFLPDHLSGGCSLASGGEQGLFAALTTDAPPPPPSRSWLEYKCHHLLLTGLPPSAGGHSPNLPFLLAPAGLLSCRRPRVQATGCLWGMGLVPRPVGRCQDKEGEE